ncbi:MAG: hypothetical protein JNM74_24570, partial [Myxococcales bacterium]|nr:hypothetical protein [Myxococcales bacterium]
RDVRFVPLVFGVVAASYVAAVRAKSVYGHPLTRDQRGRFSLYFAASMAVLFGLGALAKVPEPLEAALRAGAPFLALRVTGLACLGMLVVSAVTFGLVTLFSPRR